ncbi:putative palmitoyltransferase ZDHHC4 [Galemys pyrenaicus]|uniref:Palmitoyltransferase n=1 Tax=Galemys pyrenaicus TaxID=202257 RepID=A0A8J6DY53_GALPY|nr:putative palmitoyltransferase ZDHHC4 [Galemys pyrenaicus]
MSLLFSGTITKANELLFLQVYEFDEVMFPTNRSCSTCDLRKPARSKHCSECARAALVHALHRRQGSATFTKGTLQKSKSRRSDHGFFQMTGDEVLCSSIEGSPRPRHQPRVVTPHFCAGVCNRCVHRFDHHCIWVNNCIGAWNAKYFLIYLLTLTASAASMAAVSTLFLVQLVVVSDMYLKTYIDDLGRSQVIDIVFLIQYLFLTFPRIVFMLGFVMVLSFLLGGYLCFSLYLAATNRTTNEWRKGRAWCQPCHPATQTPSARSHVSQNIYSRGFWSNLGEIFLPAAAHYDRKKK